MTGHQNERIWRFFKITQLHRYFWGKLRSLAEYHVAAAKNDPSGRADIPDSLFVLGMNGCNSNADHTLGKFVLISEVPSGRGCFS